MYDTFMGRLREHGFPISVSGPDRDRGSQLRDALRHELARTPIRLTIDHCPLVDTYSLDDPFQPLIHSPCQTLS
jgi:hypothetical protein